MGSNGQSFVEWKEQFVSKERGKRVVHYFLKDIKGDSVLAVVGTERSVRHMFYVVAEEFLKVNEADSSVNAGYRWRSRREVVNWLTSMLSKQHRHESPRCDHVSAANSGRLARNLKLHTCDITWSGVAWTCGKQLKHFPAFCRNGITIAVQSFVYVMAEEESRHVAYLEDMYEDRKGQKKVRVRWFHHNREVQAAVSLRSPHPREVFITPNVQVISAECVDGPAVVLAREHYDRCAAALPDDLLARVHLCCRQFKSNRVKPFKLPKLCGYFDQPVFECLDDGEHGPGSKRARRREGAVTADGPPPPSRYELLRRRLVPKRAGSRPPPPRFEADEKMELLCQDSGIRGCWFRCTVLEVARRRVKVRYDDLNDEDGGGNLEEWVSALRLAGPDKLGIRRPGRPSMRPAITRNEPDAAFAVGSPVDAWWSDGWWEGVVSGTTDAEDGDVQVYVPGENMILKLHRSNIRLSRDWVGDRWVDLEPNPDILSLIPAAKEVKHDSLTISSKETPAAAATIDDNPPNLPPVGPPEAAVEEKKPSLDGVAMEYETSMKNSEASPMEVST